MQKNGRDTPYACNITRTCTQPPPLRITSIHTCRLCTWLSVDGGVSWKDVAVGTYIYEYADYGGLLIMAKHPGTSDTPTGECV